MDNDTLRKALNETSLPESVKASIQEAWETKLTETREEVAAQLRDEFALKYEKDKGEIVEAMDAMIRESLTEQVKELVEAKKSHMVAKVKTKKKLKESMDVFNKFIVESLTKEVREFKADRKAVEVKLDEMNKFVTEALAKELGEFQADRKQLVEDRVNHKIQSKKELAEAKKELISKMATVCESFIKKHLTEEMTQLKSELIEAKKKHFGMKVFESFAAEFGSSFFNERTEVKKLVSVINSQNQKIEESSKEIAKRDKMIVESNNKLRITQDRAARTKTLNELCSSLTGSKRKLMEELLEKVPTQKLTESFNTYLTAVISDNRKVISEVKTSTNAPVLKEVTGNKETLLSKANSASDQKSVLNEYVSTLHKMQKYADEN